MIGAYAHHGMGSKALNTFEAMIEAGFKPDEITFTSILNACSHSGMPRETLDILNQMEKDFSRLPDPSHISCRFIMEFS
jgi:pentatricopeptide repeat protein